MKGPMDAATRAAHGGACAVKRQPLASEKSQHRSQSRSQQSTQEFKSGVSPDGTSKYRVLKLYSLMVFTHTVVHAAPSRFTPFDDNLRSFYE